MSEGTEVRPPQSDIAVAAAADSFVGCFPQPDRDCEDRYEQLKEAGWLAAKGGRFEESLGFLEQALEEARQRADRELVDLAICNRATLLIELGQTARSKAELRKVLMASRSPLTAYLSAYSLARAYDIEKDGEKALFYAKIAHRHSGQLADPERQAESHLQLGNLLISKSDFDTARDHFEEALDLLPPGRCIRRGLALDNLGYCHLVAGKFRQAFRLLYEALRTLRAMQARRWICCVHVSLCFAHLEVGRVQSGWRHADRALTLAEEIGDREQIKGALFGLGEAQKLAGNPIAARRHFLRLQQEYYPDQPEVSDLLLMINVQKLINIKA